MQLIKHCTFIFTAFSISDVVTVNCEADYWGAAINITQLQMVYPQLNYSDIVLSERTNCYGQVVGDLLLFGQRYSECGSKSEVSFHWNAAIDNLVDCPFLISPSVFPNIYLRMRSFILLQSGRFNDSTFLYYTIQVSKGFTLG